MRNWNVNKTLIAGAVALISLASGSAFAQSYVGVNLGRQPRRPRLRRRRRHRRDHQLRQERLRLQALRRLPAARHRLRRRTDLLRPRQVQGFGHRHQRRSQGFVLGPRRRLPPGRSAAAGAAWPALGARLRHQQGGLQPGRRCSGEHSKNGWHPYYGLGVNYEIAKNIKLEADWDNTRITSQVPTFGSSTNVVNSYSIGASFGF